MRSDENMIMMSMIRSHGMNDLVLWRSVILGMG